MAGSWSPGGESVAYFKEEVVNEKRADHFFHWTQHATLGPPFLSYEHSRTFVSATRGRTFPHGYEGKELLMAAQDFQWPNAPGVDGKPVDLRRPLSHPGLGFVATVLMDPGREQQYVAGLNIRERLLVGYCFDRKAFPWTAIWEENKARADAPWHGQSETRGLEFGSTPLPVGRREAFANGPLFGAPCFSIVPALGPSDCPVCWSSTQYWETAISRLPSRENAHCRTATTSTTSGFIRSQSEHCKQLLSELGLPAPRKSSCVFCPFHGDAYWLDLKRNYPEEFAKACSVDETIRDMSKRGMRNPLYLHRSLVPLSEVKFRHEQQMDFFSNECDGYCGV